MRLRIVLFLLGKLLAGVAVTMLIPLGWSLYYQDGDFTALAVSFILMLACALFLIIFFRGPGESTNSKLRPREGFLLVTAGWLLVSFLGSLPYIFSGVCPDFAGAFFESMSGFTTTGASILTDVEIQPRGILMWRALTQWLGGMGIVALFVALTTGNSSSGGSGFLYSAETPGASLMEKLTPRSGNTSKIICLTYFLLTLALIILLCAGGMSVYDAVAHAFATLSSGGFSTKNASLAYYDSAFIQWMITLFMAFAGCNMMWFYVLLVKRKKVWHNNEELKTYLGVIVLVSVFIAVSLHVGGFYKGEGLEPLLRSAAFQTVSIITTTGYVTADYNLWPSLAQVLLFSLFFIGGCSGSTSGAIKIPRFVLLVKNTFAEVFRLAHPKAIVSIKLNHRPVPPIALGNTVQFFAIYMILYFLGVAAVSAMGLGFTESLSATASCIGNVGPALGKLGPVFNYAGISAPAKILLSIYMLLGRLELYTVLILFLPSVWKR